MRSVLISTLLVWGCEQATGTPSQSADAAGAAAPGADVTADETPLVEQTVPLEAQPTHGFNLGAVGRRDPANAEQLLFEGSIAYAVGEGYPRSVTQLTNAGRWTSCATGELGGEYRALDVSGGNDALQVALDADGNVAVNVLGEGSATVIVHGSYQVDPTREECGFAAGSTVPVTDVMTLNAIRPAGLVVSLGECESLVVTPVIGRCDPLGGIRVAAGVALSPQFRLTDAAGDSFTPWNVNWRHPAVLTIRSSQAIPPFTLSEPDYPRSGGDLGLVATDQPGWIELAAPFGLATRIEVVGPDAVKAQVEFGMMHKVWNPWDPGKSGAMYEWEFVQVIAKDVSVDGAPLCSALNNAWFHLESLSPTVCVVGEADGANDYSPGSHGLTASASPVQSGDCSLRLTAPDLDGGRGLTADFSEAIELRDL